jgi:hypothetical protein
VQELKSLLTVVKNIDWKRNRPAKGFRSWRS